MQRVSGRRVRNPAEQGAAVDRAAILACRDIMPKQAARQLRLVVRW
jgi:hypothetical protein